MFLEKLDTNRSVWNQVEISEKNINISACQNTQYNREWHAIRHRYAVKTMSKIGKFAAGKNRSDLHQHFSFFSNGMDRCRHGNGGMKT